MGDISIKGRSKLLGGGRVGFSSGSDKKGYFKRPKRFSRDRDRDKETREEKKKRKRKELSQQVSRETIHEAIQDVRSTKGKVHSIKRGQEDSAKRVGKIIDKQKWFAPEAELKKNFGEVRDKGWGGKHKKPEHN